MCSPVENELCCCFRQWNDHLFRPFSSPHTVAKKLVTCGTDGWERYEALLQERPFSKQKVELIHVVCGDILSMVNFTCAQFRLIGAVLVTVNTDAALEEFSFNATLSSTLWTVEYVAAKRAMVPSVPEGEGLLAPSANSSRSCRQAVETRLFYPALRDEPLRHFVWF